MEYCFDWMYSGNVAELKRNPLIYDVLMMRMRGD